MEPAGSAKSGKKSRPFDDVIGDVFFGTLVYVGIGLAAIAAIIGLIAEPTGETYDVAYTIYEYVPVSPELVARLLFGIAFGFLTAIAYVVLWFVALMVVALLQNRFGSPASPDYSPLPESPEIEQGLLDRLKEEGISRGDAELFIRTRRAYLNDATRGRMGELFTRMNVITTQGARVDLVYMGIDTGYVSGRGEKKFWILHGATIFVPIVRSDTVRQLQDLVDPLADAMRRKVPEVSKQSGTEVWDIGLRGGVGFTLIGARAEFDELKAGPRVFSLLDRRMLPAHGTKEKNPALFDIEFEQIGQLKTHQ